MGRQIKGTCLFLVISTILMLQSSHGSLYGQSERTSRPNIIIILADDLGYGDLSTYGGRANTPNIDKLATEGMKFTDFHSNGANCSPTRASLLTGRYQQRIGIESALGENAKGIGSEKAKGTITMADYLQTAGYKTAIIGKWHLGYNVEQNPIHYGFDEFRGMLHGATDYHSHVNTFGRFDWWHNNKLVKEEGYVTDLITQHSVDLMDQWKDQPFFLFVSHLAIHFPWQTPDDKAHRVEGKKYRAKGDEPLSRHGQHTPHQYQDVVYSMIERLDQSVGSIMKKLGDLNLDNETLILFLSDNGGIIQESGFPVSSNGMLRGAKNSLYEGGHRIPAIARWSNKIDAGSTTNEIGMTMDVLPTIMDLVKIPLPDQKSKNSIDGISFTPLLFDKVSLPSRTLFWKKPSGIAVRSSEWKLVSLESERTPELYYLKNDISEKNNVASVYPQIVENLIHQSKTFIEDVYK